ncbi:MAG: DMT family transporter [Desulfurococcales archaeon]|nr:DMT family transporter [Desulfurococcales archaeon]
MGYEPYGILFAFLAGFMFAVSDVSVRVASSRLTPFQNLVVSLASGLPVLWAMAVFFEGPPRPNAGLALYAIAGLLHFIAGRLLFYTAIAGLGATSAAITSSPTVVFSSLLAWIFLGESLGSRDVVGIVLVSIAVYMAITRPSGIPLQGVGRGLALASGVVASLIFSITAVVVRAAGLETGAPITGVSVSYTAALPVALAIAAARRHNMALKSGGAGILLVAVWAGIAVGLAQTFRYLALYATTVANAMVLISLFPLHTLVLSRIASKRLGEERVTVRHLAAGILAVTGIVLVVT